MSETFPNIPKTVSIDVEQLRSDRLKLERTLGYAAKELERIKLEINTARKQSPQRDFPTRLGIQKSATEEQIRKTQEEIENLKNLELAVKKFQSTKVEVTDNLENLRSRDPQQVASLEKGVAQYEEILSKLFNQQSKAAVPSGIEPKLSFVPPNVRYVDANHAYKYADLQQDTNILIGFTTLFLGVCISAGISLGVSLATSSERAIISIHATITVMSLVISFIFGYLAWQARKKSNEAKKLLESSIDEKEVALHFAPFSNGSLDGK